jgi:peptidoglycan/LPS O-acetylase OafA/YrhL
VRSGTRIDGLDLLRGLAVGLVVLRHALPDVLPGAGAVGVVMFFAISGFLITGLLVDERERTGRVRLRRFYARRARRLLPALLALVAGYLVVTLLLDPLADRSTLLRDVAVALTFTGDLPHLTPAGATYHLWTLAVEEQLYLVWPALLLLVGPRRGVLMAGLAALLACAATTAWLREAPDLAYALPTSWAGCFVLGAAARVHRGRLALPGWAAPCALAGLGLLGVVELRGHVLTYLAGGPLIAALTCVLLLSWHTWRTVTGPARAVVWLGTVSYGAYLWNYPLSLWLRPLDAAGAVLAVALTLAAAALSHRWVERPFLAPRPRALVAAP